MEKPEILAPAGSMEALRAAFSAGADAVYMGGTGFGARAYADNPKEEEMLEAIRYAHLRGKRLYLTVNTLIKEQEFKALYEFLAPYYSAGLDAAIVQDVGVLCFLAKEFPGLALHASTQMTLTADQGISLFDGYPVTRLVPARELSLTEIKNICKNSGKEVEIFVHGALCYCYSGQCLMSSLIGGRSGNRGRCAQPCRMEYESTTGSKKHWLSPKDLCGLTNLPELIETGAASFKIEGRMKRPEYAAAVTAAYRKYVDLYETLGKDGYVKYRKEHPEELQTEVERLADVYNRGGFTDGFFLRHNGKNMMSVERPGHFGVPVGEVVAGGTGSARIRFHKEMQPQDVVELRRAPGAEQGMPGYYEYTLGAGIKPGDTVTAKLLPKLQSRPGDKVYRMRNARLLQEISDSFCKKESKVPVKGRFYAKAGEICILEVTAGCVGLLPPTAFPHIVAKPVTIRQEGFVCEAAGKLPATEESVKKQLNKTGNEAFFFEQLDVVLEDGVFLPNGLLNELRRTALEALAQKLQENFRRESVNGYAGVSEMLDVSETMAYVDCLVSTREQAEAAAGVPSVRRLYLELFSMDTAEICRYAKALRETGKEVWFALPRICRSATLDRLKRELPSIADAFDGYLVRNYESLALLKAADAFIPGKCVLDYTMYVMNREAKVFYKELLGETEGMFTVPQELSAGEMKHLGISDMTLVVYGRIPLMVSAHCIEKNTGTCKKERRSEQTVPFLIDRVGKRLPVKQVCKDCYNLIYNPECLSLLEKAEEINQLAPYAVRFDFTTEGPEEVRRGLLLWENGYDVVPKGTFGRGSGYTKGHFARGVE